MLAVLTVRIPEETKEEMKKYPDMNWSEILRETIDYQLMLKRRQEAAKKMDEIRSRMKPLPAGTIVKWIREDRDG